MSSGERIAATAGVCIATAAMAVLGMVSLSWVLGAITGWLLCSAVNRRPG